MRRLQSNVVFVGTLWGREVLNLCILVVLGISTATTTLVATTTTSTDGTILIISGKMWWIWYFLHHERPRRQFQLSPGVPTKIRRFFLRLIILLLDVVAIIFRFSFSLIGSGCDRFFNRYYTLPLQSPSVGRQYPFFQFGYRRSGSIINDFPLLYGWYHD